SAERDPHRPHTHYQREYQQHSHESHSDTPETFTTSVTSLTLASEGGLALDYTASTIREYCQPTTAFFTATFKRFGGWMQLMVSRRPGVAEVPQISSDCESPDFSGSCKSVAS